MEMKITFPDNKKVTAHYKGFTIETDQPINEGGNETAPEPFSLFLASIGTCVGIYLINFLQKRNLSTQDLSLILTFKKNMATNLFEQIKIMIHTPKNLPPKYHQTLIKVANLCTVKRHLDNPPQFKIDLTAN